MLPDVATTAVHQGTVLLAHAETTLWLMLRIGAMLTVAPLIGTRATPARVRVILTGMLALTLAPFLPVAPGFTVPDAALVLAVARELAIGACIGLILRLAFEAGAWAGEAVSFGMGLAFAQMADPLRGQNSGVVGQFFYIALALLFFSIDGHLALVKLVYDSYLTVPPTTPMPDPVAVFSALPNFVPAVLHIAFRIALPVMLALLVVNLAFGLLGRAAPSFNPIQVGLPASLLVGLVLLGILVGEMMEPVLELFNAAFRQAGGMFGG